LRHESDKILVGEIRDNETAQIAINSALTGHLVFTTVHANNVLDVLGRFLNMGVELYNFVSALNCILAQRLVRMICPHCKKQVTYPDSYLVESGLDPGQWRDVPLYEGAGCFECGGTGFRGRSAISELLDLSDNIRDLILNRRSSTEIRRKARDAVMSALVRIAPPNGNRRRPATVILPDYATRVSLLDFDSFPSSPEEQLPLVRFRVKKTIPFDIDSAAVSYWAQPASTKAGAKK